MNLVCNTDLTTQGRVGQCECRRDMRWNTGEGECQFYMDVDCSSFTYDTPPSPVIMEAVERANTAGQARPGGTTLEEELGQLDINNSFVDHSASSPPSQDRDQAGESGEQPPHLHGTVGQ